PHKRAPEGNSPFAKLAELDLYNAAERTRARDQQAWVERLVEAPFEELTTGARGGVRSRWQRVARRMAGPALLRPEHRLILPPGVSPGSRERVQRKLSAYRRDLATHLLSPLKLAPADTLSAPMRGLLYQLEQGLGTVPRRQAAEQLSA